MVVCEHCGTITCGTRIVGHGVETDGTFTCCAHCAEQDGETGFEDRI
jgi:hypothetical protein